MPLTISQFFDRLRESGVLSPDEIDALWNRVPKDKRSVEAERFAVKLVEVSSLTAFQATSLLNGEGNRLVLGDYVLLEQIGAGGMGQVFRALHRRLKRLAAIKVLPTVAMEKPSAIKRFQREAEAAAKLSHPNIVSVYDAGEQKGIHYLAMEYAEGVDLAKLVQRNGPLTVEQAISYVSQAALGLAHAHSQGVIHRDIKPANLLLDAHGTLKILDLGLARFADHLLTESVEELTKTGTFMGSVDFMSPEQALDTRSADARSDQYSLGCTLFYLLTGKPMYAGDTVMKRLVAHREARIPSLTVLCHNLPADLNAVFLRMVAKKPEQRYQSMDELRSELSTCLLPDRGELSVPANLTAVSSVGNVPAKAIVHQALWSGGSTPLPPRLPVQMMEPPIISPQAYQHTRDGAAQTEVGIGSESGWASFLKSSASRMNRLGGGEDARKRIIFFASCGAACIACILAVGGFFLMLNSSSRARAARAAEKVADGDRYFVQGNMERAIECYSQAIHADERFVDAYIRRGDAFSESWQKEAEAIADYTAAIRLRPRSAAAYYGRGVVHWTFVDSIHREQAIEDLSAAIRLEPTLPKPYRYRAQAYFDKGDRARAISDCTESVRLAPNDALSYHWRGLLFSKMGEHEKAVADYSDAIRLDPMDRDHRWRRGEAYVALHQYDKALEDYGRAIEIDPRNRYLYQGRSQVHVLKGDQASSIADQARAEQLANAKN